MHSFRAPAFLNLDSRLSAETAEESTEEREERTSPKRAPFTPFVRSSEEINYSHSLGVLACSLDGGGAYAVFDGELLGGGRRWLNLICLRLVLICPGATLSLLRPVVPAPQQQSELVGRDHWRVRRERVPKGLHHE